MAPKDMLQVGEVARRAGVSQRTVRYYEERGLLAAAERTSGGMRIFGAADVARLKLIVRLKTLGLNLDEIATTLGASQAEAPRPVRAERTLELLRLERAKAQEQLETTLELQREIDEALASVQVCARCTATECPTSCKHHGHLL